MNLNNLRDKAYQCAIAHGWHDQEYSDQHFLCLVISELMEAVEADRKGKRANRAEFKRDYEDEEPHDNANFIYNFECCIKNSVEDELADACIRLLDLAGKNSIDLTFAESLLTEHSSIIIAGSLTEAMYVLCGLLSKTTEKTYNKVNYAIEFIAKYCKGYVIDIFWFIEQKMKYNELRPYKHGDKSY